MEGKEEMDGGGITTPIPVAEREVSRTVFSSAVPPLRRSSRRV